jgi:maltooligosyltrehalose trehalohydrolase
MTTTYGWQPTLGAVYLGENRCQFTVWAPRAKHPTIRILGSNERSIPLEAGPHGYYTAVVEDLPAGACYWYELKPGLERPDPCSRWQPDGVHGPSAVVDPAFGWRDQAWAGLPLRSYVLYELHVGTFTPEGTFEAVIPHLDRLKELGVTVIELMPVAQFPGSRNWGYDGVYLFGVQNSYGGPAGLKQLVDACHARGLGVCLDVVYNHLGPEGNYTADFAPYFTDHYKTPWGAALNFDGPHSDEVRRFFLENALYWVTEYHIDALRLDAVHAIMDQSPVPFLQELGEAVHLQSEILGRRIHLIAESDADGAHLIRSRDRYGYGLDAQWNDDFHHALHVQLTGESAGYYEDFQGLENLAKAYRNGYVFTGEYNRFRNRRHGSPSQDIPATRFVVFAQNHDQTGNRMLGERLGALVSFEKQKLTAGAVLLSPFLPLLFMGEEYGETAPFLYFVSHTDAHLVEAVRKGRRAEFKAFTWQGEPPDPQSEEAFAQSRLRHELRDKGNHQVLHDFYRHLLSLRRDIPALAHLSKDAIAVSCDPEDGRLVLYRTYSNDQVWMCFNFSDQTIMLPKPPQGRWRKIVDSSDEKWNGPGSMTPDELPGKETQELSPSSFVLYRVS